MAELAGKLKSEFGGTHYAQYGSLFVAKVAVDSGKLDDAVAELKAVMDKPADATLGELARQRLARVLAAQGKVEEGLKLLDGDADKAYVSTREELRGDLLVQLKRTDEARAAYEKAKQSLPEDGAGDALQIKLDDLSKGEARDGAMETRGAARPGPGGRGLQQQQQEGTPARRTDRLQRGSRVEQAVEPLGR